MEFNLHGPVKEEYNYHTELFLVFEGRTRATRLAGRSVDNQNLVFRKINPHDNALGLTLSKH